MYLAKSVASGLSIINGQTYKIGQVGSFVRVPQGYQDLFGVVSAVGANASPPTVSFGADTGRWMKVELVGEIVGTHFDRGVSQYPNVGDQVHLAVEGQLRRIYEIGDNAHIEIGTLSSATSIAAKVALDELVDSSLGSFGHDRFREVNHGNKPVAGHLRKQ